MKFSRPNLDDPNNNTFVNHWITPAIDWFFDTLGDAGSHKNAGMFQFIILVINVCLSIHPLVCYFTICQDEHVVFWLGTTPSWACLLVPATMFFMNIQIAFLQFFKGTRKRTQVSLLRILLTIGIPLLVAGVWVYFEAAQASNQLGNNCGRSPLSSKIQSEWTKVRVFQQACEKKKGEDEIMTPQCAGFDKKFGGNDYAVYIQDMEYDFDCQGFCQVANHALFNKASSKVSCSNALSEETMNVGWLVGAPIAGIGLSMILTAACLQGYNHL